MSQSAGEHISMTIHADDIYRQYAQDQDPQKLFEKATKWISTIQLTPLDDKKQELVNREVHESMLRAIFGSNMIERAGLGWDITVHLCRKIFSGEDIREIPERDASYQDALLEIYLKQPDLKHKPAQYVLRGRNEIVQHAKAFQYIIHAFVTEKQDLTEDLIKETHRILTKGVPIIQSDGRPDVPPEKYGGIYRTVIVGAGSTIFTVPKFVPAKMKEMCEALKQELAAAEERGTIDPFSIAAKYSLEFVQIHPFQDGNGRCCRMILNAILCRYAGVIVPIGEGDEERQEYMGIKRRSNNMDGHGEYATFVLQRAVTRLREMKKKLTGKSKPGAA
jgi:fido (protein-threonine AMPylation protein)